MAQLGSQLRFSQGRNQSVMWLGFYLQNLVTNQLSGLVKLHRMQFFAVVGLRPSFLAGWWLGVSLSSPRQPCCFSHSPLHRHANGIHRVFAVFKIELFSCPQLGEYFAIFFSFPLFFYFKRGRESKKH